jgi:predicted ribosome quality control (RQC) complex YloA/Tae2 family protein
MERRELLKMIAVLTGGALIGGDVFLSGCKTGVKKGEGLLSTDSIALLNEVGDTIIPVTNTPGAKAAGVGEFMNVFVNDCYRADEQKAFTEGLTALDKACEKQFGKDFTKLTAAERTNILTALEAEAKSFNQQINDKEKAARDIARKEMKEFNGAPLHYYTMIKQLTLFGYFSSEIGMKQALRFLPVPGKYDGAYPYKKGDKAWAI